MSKDLHFILSLLVHKSLPPPSRSSTNRFLRHNRWVWWV